MEIIRASVENKNAVYALLCELENKKIDRAQFETSFLRNMTNKDIFYLLAVENDVVVGFASIHVQLLLHHAGPVGEIQEIIVNKKYRGQNVGKMLYHSLKEIAEENSCVLLEVCCNQSRIESHPFYLSQGMQNTHYKFTLPLTESISQ